MKTQSSLGSWMRHASLLSAGVAALALLAACDGGAPRASGKMRVDLAPLMQQLGGGGDRAPAGAGRAPASIADPGASQTTTDVQTLLIGALVIDFTNTPLGPDSTIDDATRNHIKDAVGNSVKFFEIVQLPTSDAFVEFDLPPAAATHWQVGIAATRDKISAFEDVKDDSVIWYGFNQDATGKPVFLTTSSLGSAPIDVVMTRACIASSNIPKGCAAFFFKDRTAAVTDAVEIVDIQLDTTGTGVFNSVGALTYPVVVRAGGSATVGAACATAAGCSADAVTAYLNQSSNVPGLSTAKAVKVVTTHMLSTGQPAACATLGTTGAALTVINLLAQCAPPDTVGGPNTTQNYTTRF